MTLRRFVQAASGAFGSFADRWLPRGCALCDATLARTEDGLCDPCHDSLPGVRAARCLRCGLAVGGHGEPALGERSPGAPALAESRAGPPGPCAACRGRPPAFERSFVLADYAAPLDRLVHALKFRGELALASALGARMAPLLQAAGWPADALVPVPLGPERIATRGFNQSAAIARSVGRRLGLPVCSGLLARTRETPAQSTLALAARHANLVDAFRATPAVGLRLVLVDDVMTSGATLKAAAAALGAAGAARVAVLVAARTP